MKKWSILVVWLVIFLLAVFTKWTLFKMILPISVLLGILYLCYITISELKDEENNGEKEKE